MRVRQYVYFALFSRYVSAAEMAARLGIEPDELMVRGSRLSDPVVPVCHAWMVVCRDAGLSVDEQIARVLDRLIPHRQAIARLSAELMADDSEHGGARLSVVRYFNAEDGEEEQLSAPDDPLQKLPGQHQLLGWVLESEVMRFLLETGACVDVDEYG